MYSVPCVMDNCFSPLTTRLRLGSTSSTVTLIVPVKLLAEAASPFPAKSLAVEAPMSTFLVMGTPNTIGGTSTFSCRSCWRCCWISCLRWFFR